MTRENKLALIIGFGLVLVVGILVSDHLSAAHRQESADLTGDPVATSNERLRDTALLTPVYAGRDTAQREAETQPNPRSADALDRTARRVNGSETALRQSQTPPLHTDQGIRIDHLADVPADIPDAIVMPDQGVLVNSDLATARERIANSETQQVAFQWYTIKNGETLAKIAKDRYGDANLWRSLHEINKDRIPNPNVVPAGVTIRLPKELATGSGGGSAGPAASETAPPSGGALRMTTYTVQPGESLSKVASKVLGSGTKWRELYELNKDVIKNPDNVPAGTVLKVPAR